MKTIMMALAVCLTLTATAQDIRISGDTIYYGKNTFYAGKEIKLGYGSKADKSFAYIKYGDVMKSISPLADTYAKMRVTIVRVYKSGAGFTVVAKLPEPYGTKDSNLYIMVEQAVDQKELLTE